MGIEILYAVAALLLLGALIWGANHYRDRRQGEREGDQGQQRTAACSHRRPDRRGAGDVRWPALRAPAR